MEKTLVKNISDMVAWEQIRRSLNVLPRSLDFCGQQEVIGDF